MKVRNVRKGPKIQTLDISVGETHSYQIENGVVVHNTLGKRLDSYEGVHTPLAKYLINNMIISNSSPIHALVKKANYRMMIHPSDSSSSIVSIPIKYEDGTGFSEVTLEDGRVFELNTESAIEQLERYRLWMHNYVDHNCSISVSYSVDEIEDIIDWLTKHWDKYVGVSWILRIDAAKLAKDPKGLAESLGYPYLPQYPITKQEYDEYAASLLPINISSLNTISSLDALENDCAGGACPIR